MQVLMLILRQRLVLSRFVGQSTGLGDPAMLFKLVLHVGHKA